MQLSVDMRWTYAFLLVILAGNTMAGLRDDQSVVAEVDRNAAVCIRGDVEVRSLAGSLSDSALQVFSSLAEKGVGDISRFTGVPAPQRIVIYLSPRVDISHTYPHYPLSERHEPRLFIDSERVADHSAPYLHELVHAVAGSGGAMWMEEGFASWVASSIATQYGGYYASALSKGNDEVDTEARAVLDRTHGTEASCWFAPGADPQLNTQRDRRSFYILAHSFTKFLAHTLGTRELVRIHRANDSNSLARLSGVSIDQWEQRWRSELGEGDPAAVAQP